MDPRTEEIVREAVSGSALGADDIKWLLRLPEDGDDAAFINTVARKIAFQAAEGFGYVFAQIGVDALPCPENCRFCSFAACNTPPGSIGSAEDAVLPIEEVVSLAEVFGNAEVGLISLMATASLSGDRFIEMAVAVRRAVPEKIVILANIGDMDEEYASRLSEAGIQAFYHALRLGEGEITDIDPAARLATIREAKRAGLQLMSGIEPIWKDADIEELASLILLQRELEPFATGACPLTISEGCDVGGLVPADRARVQQIASIARLACGTSVPIGGAGGVAWVDAGTDPRSRGYGSSPSHLLKMVQQKRALLADAGWKVDEPKALAWAFRR